MASHSPCGANHRWSAPLSVAVLALGALALSPSPAGAVEGPRWGASVRVSLGAPVGAPDVVVAPRTGTGVVWTGATSGAATPDVRFRQQTRYGVWQDPVSLGAGGGAQIGADESGNMVAAWYRTRPGMIPEVVAARRAVGHNWGAPVVISRTARDTGDGTVVRKLDLAVSTGGAAVAAWQWGSDEGGPSNRVQAAYLPAGGSWSGPTDVTTSSECHGGDGVGGLATAIGPGGRAVVVCQGPDGVVRAVRQSASQWPDPVPVSTGPGARSPDVAVGPDGETVAVWSQSVPPDEEDGESSTVIATSRLGSAGWPAPEQLTLLGEVNSTPRIAESSDGATTIVWHDSAGVVWSRWRTAGSAPYARSLSLGSASTTQPLLDLATNLDGDAVVAWSQPAGPSGNVMVAVTKPGDGPWGPATVISGSAVVAAEVPTGVAIGGCGRATVAWQGNYTRLKRTLDCL